jgi:hypothetical protein
MQVLAKTEWGCALHSATCFLQTHSAACFLLLQTLLRSKRYKIFQLPKMYALQRRCHKSRYNLIASPLEINRVAQQAFAAMSMSNSSNSYDPLSNLKYTPLPSPRFIRVLVLSSGEYTDNITCSLRPVDLDEHPQYDALSYVWGDRSNPTNITCDGHSIRVTKNLGAALRRLRDRSLDQVVWVDALCINQADLDERNAQVRMMADIYRKASLVKVYLGEMTPDSLAAMHILQTLCGAALDDSRTEEEEINILQVAYWQGKFDGFPSSKSPDWESFQEFFRQEYFSRMWVLQEVALATKDPVIMYGEKIIEWEVLTSAARMWHASGLFLAQPKRDLSFNVILIDQYRTASSTERKQHFTLMQLLRHTKRCRATDPRDRIYALYGLASDIYDQNGKATIEPNYHDSVEKVYREVAASLIRRGENLDLLPFCQRPLVDNGRYLPSWVPDWTVFDDQLPDFIHVSSLLSNSSGLLASSNFAGQGSVSSDIRILRVSGVLIDAISWVSEPLKSESLDMLPEFRKNPGVLKRLWDKVAESFPESYHGLGCSTKEAFWRTLIANMGNQRQEAGPDYRVHFLSFWRLTRQADHNAAECVRNGPQFHLAVEGDQTWETRS